MELARDGTVRLVIGGLVLLGFLLLTAVFYIAPLTLYETIVQASGTLAGRLEQLRERFAVRYYGGGSGRLGSFFSALAELVRGCGDAAAGEEDQAEMEDLMLLADSGALKKTYARKIRACREKIRLREEALLQCIREGMPAQAGGATIQSVMASRFLAEQAGSFEGQDGVRVQYDGVNILGVTRELSAREAVALLTLYSSQTAGSLRNIRLSGLLKWLGFSAGTGHRLCFPLGENRDVVYALPAWKGTFLPQYLADEADAAGSRDRYGEELGCSAADLLLEIDCPDLYSVRAAESEEILTETRVRTEYVPYVYRDYQEAEKPVLSESGEVLSMAGPYHWEYSGECGRWMPVRNADAPEAPYAERVYTFAVQRQREETVTVVHVSYTVPVFIRTRPAEELAELCGLWEGWLPWDPPALAAGGTGQEPETPALRTGTVSPAPFAADSARVWEAFAREYGWQGENRDAARWQGRDGKTYSRPWGHQRECYEDCLALARKLCVSIGILTESAGGGSGSGASIAAAARAETDAPDCAEDPPGSNCVKYNTWRYGRPVSGEAYGWCANFVAWCAGQCGYVESGLFDLSESVRGVLEYQTQTNGFSAFPAGRVAQLGGGECRAVPGDLWCFGLEHIGIVTAVTDSSLEITQGNTGDRVMSIVYTAADLGGALGAEDCLVHVEYPADRSFLYAFLTGELGLPPAAAAGVLSNMWSESRFDPGALGDGGTSYGLCQWHDGRWDALREFCDASGLDWESAEGQLHFLKSELESGTSGQALLARLRACPDTPEGAAEAAEDFCICFERPADAGLKAAQRGRDAAEIFYPLFVLGEESAFEAASAG